MDVYREKRTGKTNKFRNRIIKKETRVILINTAEKTYKKITDNTLKNSIKQKIEFLKQNPFYGDNIKKKKIPKKYDVQNLWRIELAKYWRAIYTINTNQNQTICFIIEIVDHKEYNKLFGYKKN